MSGICIDRLYLKSDCCSEQIVYAIAKESLILITLLKGHQQHKFFNTVTPNASKSHIEQM